MSSEIVKAAGETPCRQAQGGRVRGPVLTRRIRPLWKWAANGSVGWRAGRFPKLVSRKIAICKKRSFSMKALLRIACLAVILGAPYFSNTSRIHAMGGLKPGLQNQQGPKITTPTHAFLQKQCNALKKGIASLPGMKQLFPNSRLWGTQMK
jgi:hypothetical protein